MVASYAELIWVRYMKSIVAKTKRACLSEADTLFCTNITMKG